MGCLANIPHPKPTKHGTYKYQKFGTARLSAPADTPADAADPTVARALSSTAAAACDAPHGAAFVWVCTFRLDECSPVLGYECDE